MHPAEDSRYCHQESACIQSVFQFRIEVREEKRPCEIVNSMRGGEGKGIVTADEQVNSLQNVAGTGSLDEILY